MIATEAQAIRQVSAEELPGCLTLGRLFHEEFALPGTFKPEVFLATWQRYYALQMGTIIGWFHEERMQGAIGGLLFDDPNTGDKYGIESFWYVHPLVRGTRESIKLFRHFEDWVSDAGARGNMMIHLPNAYSEALSAFYQRRGYRLLETVYLKEFHT